MSPEFAAALWLASLAAGALLWLARKCGWTGRIS